MEIIIDTNFLITAIKQGIKLFDYFKEEHPEKRIIVPIEVIKELEVISEDPKYTTKEREAADLAIFMVKKKNIDLVPLATKDVDAGILRYAIQNEDTFVATLDKELKERIKNKNSKVKFLTIRSKNKIELQ